MERVEWVFEVVGGFLLGAFLYTGYYTTRFEPRVKPGYILIGLGILTVVGVNTYLDYAKDISHWYTAVTLTAYSLITTGLIYITIQRRKDN